MSVKPLKPIMHIIFWICVSILFLLTIALFKSILLPFVLGGAVAYLLSPLVGKMGNIGIGRSPAAFMILGGFLILISGFIAVLAPILYRELLQFSNDLPEYIEKIRTITKPITEHLDEYIGGDKSKNIENILTNNSSSALSAANYLAQKVTSGGQALMDILSVVVFMPIVAYFMMKEWVNITNWIYDLIPPHSQKVVMGLLNEIDNKISGFVRGQITVAFFLGIAYAIALSIAGLKYGILIGLMSGLISVIPMVGSAVGLIVSVAVAWFQAGELSFVAIIAAIFIIGQLVEGNYLTPKLVGDSVGLHPLWVFFALLAGSSLLGILGMFLSVPIAAIIGVLLTFALKKYKDSSYYKETDIEKTVKVKSPKKNQKS